MYEYVASVVLVSVDAALQLNTCLFATANYVVTETMLDRRDSGANCEISKRPSASVRMT